MAKNDNNHLTAEELTLLAMFREMDERDRHRVMLAAEAVRVTADQRRNPFAF